MRAAEVCAARAIARSEPVPQWCTAFWGYDKKRTQIAGRAALAEIPPGVVEWRPADDDGPSGPPMSAPPPPPPVRLNFIFFRSRL